MFKYGVLQDTCVLLLLESNHSVSCATLPLGALGYNLGERKATLMAGASWLSSVALGKCLDSISINSAIVLFHLSNPLLITRPTFRRCM